MCTSDWANRRTSMTQGSLTWSYSFDAGNRLSTTTSPYSEVTTNAFDSANRVTSVTSGDSSVAYYSYDAANRVTEVQHKTSGGTTLSDYQYGYDRVDCTSQTDTDGTVTDYVYDDADQLTSEVRDNTHSTGYSISYTYDHNQNRLTKVLNSVTDRYSYDSQNKLTGITGSVTKSYGYDSNGNCTSVAVGSGGSPPTTYLTYDYENRVSGITYPSSATNSFSYNGNDLRIKKVDSSGTRNFITDGVSPAVPVLRDGLATFTPGLSERRSSTSKFYHGDALGSTRSITDSSQSVTDTKRFDGFGMLMASAGTNPTPFGFAGGEQYQTDADSGLMLLGHRYYDCSIGRFISKDPAKAGTNWYSYTENNPLSRLDPTGLVQISAGLGATVLVMPGVAWGDVEIIIDFPSWNPLDWGIGFGIHGGATPGGALGVGWGVSLGPQVGFSKGDLKSGPDNGAVVGRAGGGGAGAGGSLTLDPESGELTGGGGAIRFPGPTYGGGLYGGSNYGHSWKWGTVGGALAWIGRLIRMGPPIPLQPSGPIPMYL